MKYVRNFYIILIVFYFLSIFYSLFSELIGTTIQNPYDYARITDIEYVATLVDSPNNNKLIVTERLTYDIHAASKDNLFWELWRDLPETIVDGVEVNYNVLSVKQILDDGSELEYSPSSKLYWYDSDYTSSMYGPGKWYHSEGPYSEARRQYECVLFYVDGIYRDEVVFEIEYEMSNAALKYLDCSELYISMYSGDTIKYLDSFKGQILIPNNDMPSQGNFNAYTYGTNSHEFNLIQSEYINPGYYTFSFDLNTSKLKFRPYNQYLEFALISFNEDKHSFTDYASINNYSYSNMLDKTNVAQAEYENLPNIASSNKIKAFFIFTIVGFVIAFYSIKKEKDLANKYNIFTPSTNYEYFREIPSNLDPNFAAHLVFCKSNKKKKDSNVFSSIMLSLVRKKYILLEQIYHNNNYEANNMIIKLLPVPTQIPEDDFLTPTEIRFLNLIIKYARNDEIKMDKFNQSISNDYQNTNSFITSVKNSVSTIGMTKEYFQEKDFDKIKIEYHGISRINLIIGILLIIICNFISYHTRLDLAYGAFFILGGSFIYNSYKLKQLANKYILLTQLGEDEYSKWRGLYNFLNSQTLMNERTAIELPIWEQYLVYATAFGISKKVTKAFEIRCDQNYNSPILNNRFYYSRGFTHTTRNFNSSFRSASVRHSSSLGGHSGYGGAGRGGGGGRWWSLKQIYNNKVKIR